MLASLPYPMMEMRERYHQFNVVTAQEMDLMINYVEVIRYKNRILSATYSKQPENLAISPTTKSG